MESSHGYLGDRKIVLVGQATDPVSLSIVAQVSVLGPVLFPLFIMIYRMTWSLPFACL